jgi:hypothetical protein
MNVKNPVRKMLMVRQEYNLGYSMAVDALNIREANTYYALAACIYV